MLNLQLLEGMICLDDTLEELTKLDIKQYNVVDKIGDKSEIFSKKNIKSFLTILIHLNIVMVCVWL